MIDVHCHLEQKDYDSDRDEVIERCRRELKAIVTSCAHPKDFDLTMKIVQEHKGFVFATAGIHPEYIKDISTDEINNFIAELQHNRDKIVGIGESGLDYYYIKEPKWQEKQKDLFITSIELAKKLGKSLVIHCRNAHEDTIKILEENDAKDVVLHLWGAHAFVSKINECKWYVSFGPLIATSKTHKRIARDMPLERILLETDSPWFGGKTPEGKPIRGEPINIRLVAKKIAEIKELSFEDVWKQCGKNAIKLFSLPI